MKGKRGIGLNRPCTKCGQAVPSMFVSPVSDGLCGKCTDQILRERGEKPAAASYRIVQSVPGGGSTIVGFMVGFAAGVLLCLALAVFSGGVWGNLVQGLKGIFGG